LRKAGAALAPGCHSKLAVKPLRARAKVKRGLTIRVRNEVINYPWF
jgi:hypothetical protein